MGTFIPRSQALHWIMNTCRLDLDVRLAILFPYSNASTVAQYIAKGDCGEPCRLIVPGHIASINLPHKVKSGTSSLQLFPKLDARCHGIGPPIYAARLIGLGLLSKWQKPLIKVCWLSMQHGRLRLLEALTNYDLRLASRTADGRHSGL